jgi:DMATS type aromatic prenyltransferase
MATFNETASGQLRALCDALEMKRDFPEALLLQRFLFDRWGDRPIPVRPKYRSILSDDHSPYEYSVAFGPEGSELRLLLEAQADKPGLQANQLAARALTQKIVSIFPVGTERLEAVSDLFLPSEPQGLFSYWHAIVLGKQYKPKFKIYFNPQVRGQENAPALVAEALSRLGLGGAARLLRERVAWRGPERDEFNYFSLDLSDKGYARVKVYLCHHQATAADLERSVSVAPSHVPGDIAEYCMQILGHGGPFARKPISSCFSFVEGSEAPTSATFHLPIAHYVTNDEVVRGRVAAFMRVNALDVAGYTRLMANFSSRPLGLGAGIHTYASFRRDPSGPRLTVYLSPELYATSALAERLPRRPARNYHQ